MKDQLIEERMAKQVQYCKNVENFGGVNSDKGRDKKSRREFGS